MNKIPSTFEMDGLLTQEDIRNRYKVMWQCRECKKWTQHNDWLPGEQNNQKPCDHCGKLNYDPWSMKSLRTYRPLVDNKRKIK